MPAPRSHPIWRWAVALAALLAAAASIYYRMFTGFSACDDDGYSLIGLRSLLQGRRLYDDIYSQYGPFYYLVHWIVYPLLGQPVSHDAERFVGCALWLLSALLWARCAYLLTRSRLLAGLVFFLAIKLLAFFPGAAGHPEETCMALLAAIAVLACGLGPTHTSRRLIALAAAVAALALTKVNIGLYLAIAIAWVLSRATPPAPAQRFGRIALGFAGVILPLAIMSPLFGFEWTRIYCLTTILSIAAVLLAGDAAPLAFLTARDWWTAGLAFAACALLIVLPFFAHGTSPGAMLYMTVLQHAGFARNWYFPAPVDRESLLVAVAAFVILGISRMARREIRPILVVLKVLIGLGCLLATVLRGSMEGAGFIFRYAVPFVWLLLVDPPDAPAGKARVGPFAICAIAVFTYLYAFPVAGAQFQFAAVPAGVVGILLLHDAFAILPRAQAFRMAPLFASLLILALLGFELRAARQSYAGGVSLGMPGATRIHVPPETAELYHWMKLSLDPCPAIYSYPGLFSLYFWTGKESPTNLTMSNSIGLLKESQQRVVVQDLSRYPGMCIVYTPALIDFWRRGQDLSQSPLHRYIQAEFKPVAEHGSYFLMKRNR